MKKNISLLLFFAIGTVVFMASYRSKENDSTPANLLTHHAWRFQKAESLNGSSAAVINALYENSQYNFTAAKTYQGEFFDRPIQGTWSFENHNTLILNGGKFSEERMEIAELTEDILKVRVIEKGSSVTITYR